jgi:NADH dehydrogenase (ubiquinone) 1 alpha subcomplex subunit 6
MALRATVARLATSPGLSAPAGAPVFSASLPEARAKARQFFREVRTRVTRLATGRAPDRLAPDADARVALSPRRPAGFVRFRSVSFGAGARLGRSARVPECPTAPLALVLVFARHARASGDERPRRVWIRSSYKSPSLTNRVAPRARANPPTQVCREVPWIMRTYWLEEVTTTAQLRSRLANEFRRASTDNPAVIDVMLFKGAQELVTVMAHHFQRHHLITKFVAPESNAIVKKTAKPQSKFLASFLSGKPTAPDGHHAY